LPAPRRCSPTTRCLRRAPTGRRAGRHVERDRTDWRHDHGGGLFTPSSAPTPSGPSARRAGEAGNRDGERRRQTPPSLSGTVKYSGLKPSHPRDHRRSVAAPSLRRWESIVSATSRSRRGCASLRLPRRARRRRMRPSRPAGSATID
jgi:hypothetical protein